MIKLAIFDWNGTILDDTHINLQAANAELAVLGLPPQKLEEHIELFEVPTINFYKKLGVSETVFKENALNMSKVFHENYEPLAVKARTRPGTRNCLNYLKDNKVSMIILSNHTLESIYLHLNRLKLTDYFETVLANEEGHIGQLIGKDVRLKAYLDSHDYKSSEIVIIGDSVEEVVIARKFGLRNISISGGLNSIVRLKKAKPDVLVSSMTGIVKAIKEL
jgi:phosphoglycolate phosphatase-like HAD superfamily hydrolase